jgi:predicted peptidase
MNLFRKVTACFRFYVLYVLLGMTVFLLIAQFSWPAVVHWWRFPNPGEIGFDRFQAIEMADEFVIQLPATYRNGQRWPLVVFLHGSSQRGNDASILTNQALFRQKLPAVVIAPQCLASYSWTPEAVADFVEHVVSRYHTDPMRTYLVGYSMGGYGAWGTASGCPKLFAAIVPIAGGGEPSNATSFVSVAIWAFHGENDQVVPAIESKRMVEAVHNAGGNAKLTIIRGAGHDICDAVCVRSDLWNWLWQQRRAE